jgi:hypothetical protein
VYCLSNVTRTWFRAIRRQPLPSLVRLTSSRPSILEKVKRLYQRNEIEFVHGEIEDLYPDVLEIVGQSAGTHFNDG